MISCRAEFRQTSRTGSRIEKSAFYPGETLQAIRRNHRFIGVVVLAYAGMQPPFHVVVNYSIGIFVLLMIIWFGIERGRFQGPPIGDAIAKRQAEIAKVETQIG